ncbi:hypothetical protein D1AOALGA4SA_8972 [Olavius algarvensis Delta 1 endosymbiont]|nr:hypothetical protein D1AOALGA4SA_8972 [Olavius algarvensis Delta 1 endosymbiont]
MKKTFNPWIHELLRQYNIPSEKTHIEQIDELLRVLFEYGVGDLLRIADFLETLNIEYAQDSRDVLQYISENLAFWDLPLLKDIPSRKNVKEYVKAAATFFSYEKYLKESERKKARGKIRLFREKYIEEEIIPDFLGEFVDIDDLLKCLENYIEKNIQEDREKLLNANFVFIKDKILEIKRNKPKTSPRAKIKKIDAPPIETILTALWLTMIDYKKTEL